MVERLFYLGRNYLCGFIRMNVLNELKVNPLNYVADLESPIGVYLRRGIFKKEAKTDAALKRKLY